MGPSPIAARIGILVITRISLEADLSLVDPPDRNTANTLRFVFRDAVLRAHLGHTALPAHGKCEGIMCVVLNH